MEMQTKFRPALAFFITEKPTLLHTSLPKYFISSVQGKLNKAEYICVAGAVIFT
jgi:hypothetical protein